MTERYPDREALEKRANRPRSTSQRKKRPPGPPRFGSGFGGQMTIGNQIEVANAAHQETVRQLGRVYPEHFKKSRIGVVRPAGREYDCSGEVASIARRLVHLVALMTTTQAEIHEAVKYCVRRCLEHEAPLDCLREYLDRLEANGWPAETTSNIGNASCRILAIILESQGTENSPAQREGLAGFLLRQCQLGDPAAGPPPKPRSGHRREEPPREPRNFPSRGAQRAGETRSYSPQSESG
jgi:hypothetical protein